MNFPFYIAKKYLFSKSSTNAINIITIIATIGVLVSSLALFIILSGFSGLRTFSFSLLNTADPDLKITPTTGKSFLFTSDIEKLLEEESKILSFSKEVEERVFLKYKGKNHIANIKGVDKNYQRTIAIDSAIVVGTWIDSDFKNTVVIGNGISYKLSLGILNFDETLDVYVPKPGKGFVNPNNAFRSIHTQVVGVYSGTEDFQNKYVFTELGLAQELLNYAPNQVSAIAIKTNIDDVEVVKSSLEKKLGSNFKIQTRQQLNALFYKVMNTENFVSYLIFTLIIIIALFNVIGAIIMMIIDKRQNLKTLFNIGATIKEVKNIFVLQGFLLTLFGMSIGLVLGVLLVYFQQKTGRFMITPTLPYPVELKISNLLIVVFTITILGFIAAKIASSRISRQFVVK